MKTFCSLIMCCCIATAQPVRPSFFMGQFRISIESMVVITQIGGHLSVQSLPQNLTQPFPGSGSSLQGVGTISILTTSLPVTFSRVVLAYSQARRRWEATIGSANGIAPSAGPHRPSSSLLNYSVGSTAVSIDKSSVHLTVESAKAKVTVLTPISIITSDIIPRLGPKLSLTSELGAIAPDGSISGDNFLGHTSFRLKGTTFNINIPQTTAQRVNLAQGSTARRETRSVVWINGLADREGLNLFSFSGNISHTESLDFISDLHRASLTLTLLNPLDRTPEAGYSLHIKNGQINYQYASGEMTSCRGSFTADLALPDINKTLHGSACTLKNITLKTDASGSLFNTVSVADTFEITRVFRVAADTAFIYFPRWMSTGPADTYLGLKTDPSCADLMERLRDQRPGVTLTKGILYFKSPQSQPQKAQLFNLKTLYLGALTFTPYGITGELTTANRTFVQSTRDISESLDTTILPRATWNTILAKGDALPKEPKAKLQLDQLQILEMRIMNLQFCKNEPRESAFRYTVHFPYPSFVDLEFEDRSLDTNGAFHKAIGPVVSHGWSYSIDSNGAAVPALKSAYMNGTLLKTVSQNPLLVQNMKPGTKPPSLPNPDTHILWAYRIPVSFTERGISIDYLSAGNAVDIRIHIDTLLNARGELVSNELWIPRLYSKNSGIKKGVRFSGTLDPLGYFEVIGLDKNPTFVRAYTKPGTERSVGLDCKLESIQLLNLQSLRHPAERSHDFLWKGQLEFPFFGWQDSVVFSVRNVIPALIHPSSLQNSRHLAVTCSGAQEILGDNAAFSLDVTANQLHYSFTSNSFTSKSIVASQDGVECKPRPESMEILSFTSAWLLLHSAGGFEQTIRVTPENACGTKIEQKLLDATFSDSRKDLICYDTAAYRIRGLAVACSKSGYYTGTFAVIETRNGKSDTTILAPKTVWYRELNKLVMQNSEMSLKSGNQNRGDRSTITLLPGAQLKIGPNSIDGKFEGAFDILGESCGVEFRFSMKTDCGYFYVLAAVQFPLYSLTFDGEIFIVHAPIELLESPPPFPGVSPVIEDIASRALTVPECLERSIHIAGLPKTTIISGVLIAGGVSMDYSVLQLAAAAGICYLQYDTDAQHTERQVSCFVNATATANLYVVEAKGYVNLYGTVSSGDFNVGGSVCIAGCVSVLIGHCSCEIRADGSFSSATGFHIGGLDISPSCDWGPCNGDECRPQCPVSQ